MQRTAHARGEPFVGFLHHLLVQWPALACFVISSAGLVSALNAGMFPGYGWAVRHPAWVVAPVVVLAWSSLHAAVAALYIQVAVGPRPDKIALRVSLGLALTIPCGVLPHLSASLGAFLHMRYLGKLYLLGCLLFLLAVLLPCETRDLWHRWRTHPRLDGRRHWLFLAVCAVLVVLGFECTFIAACFEPFTGNLALKPVALVLNAVILGCITCLVYAASSRFAFSLLLTFSLYSVFVVANILKVRYMHAALQPLDFVYLPELLFVLSWFLRPAAMCVLALTGMAVIAGSVFLWRAANSRVSATRRFTIAVLAGGGVRYYCGHPHCVGREIAHSSGHAPGRVGFGPRGEGKGPVA